MKFMEIRYSFVIISLKTKITHKKKKNMESLEYDSAA